MTEYKLTIQRTIHLIAHVYIEGDSETDAKTRFEHQLESEECSAIEDDEMWGECLHYQAIKAGPYESTYEVIDVSIQNV